MKLTWRKVANHPKWAGYERQDGEKHLVHVATVVFNKGEWSIWVGTPFQKVSHPDISSLRSAKDAKALAIEALAALREQEATL